MLGVVCRSSLCCLQIFTVLSVDLLGVVCRSDWCCLQICLVLSACTVLYADMIGVICRSARCYLHICSVLSTDFLGVVCRSARFCLQMCSVMYSMQVSSVFSADFLSVVWKCACYFLQTCSIFSADLLSVVCRPAQCCLQICSVLSVDNDHKCESGSPMFSSGPEPLGVKPCLVLIVHFDCSSSELTSLCTFLSNQSLCLYVISFFLQLISKPSLLQRAKLGVPFNLNVAEQTLDSKFS